MLEAASKANSSPHTRARLVWCGVAALTCFGVIAVLVAGSAPASDTDGNDFHILTLPESSAVDRTAVDSNTLLTDVSRFHPADGVSSDFTTVVPVAMELGLERLRMAAKPWWTEPDDSPLFRPSKFEFSHKGGPNAAITPRGTRDSLVRDHEVTLLATFPRGGSSLLLHTIEILCGGECVASSVNKAVLPGRPIHRHGDHGQYITTPRLRDEVVTLLPGGKEWSTLGQNDSLVVKTHHPLVSGFTEAGLISTRLVRLVRNPLGHILSHARHVALANAGGDSIVHVSDYHLQKEAQRRYSAAVKTAVAQWAAFMERWRHLDAQLRAAGVPVLVVRTEDLCMFWLPVLKGVLRFMRQEPVALRVADIPSCEMRRITKVIENDLLQVTSDVGEMMFDAVQQFAVDHGYDGVVADLKAKTLHRMPKPDAES